MANKQVFCVPHQSLGDLEEMVVRNAGEHPEIKHAATRAILPDRLEHIPQARCRNCCLHPCSDEGVCLFDVSVYDD